MANHKSALKRIRRNEKKALVNKDRISKIRTFIKKVEAAIDAKDKKTATAEFNITMPQLHKAVNKNLFHKNTVARKISQLSLKINAL